MLWSDLLIDRTLTPSEIAMGIGALFAVDPKAVFVTSEHEQLTAPDVTEAHLVYTIHFDIGGEFPFMLQIYPRVEELMHVGVVDGARAFCTTIRCRCMVIDDLEPDPFVLVEADGEARRVRIDDDAFENHNQFIVVDSSDLARLEWPVRALAQPQEVQASLFPRFVCVADELALEFEEQIESIGIERIRALMISEQWEAFEALDHQMITMSGSDPAHKHFWTDEGLKNASEWEAVRFLARELIHRMQWSPDPPASTSALYVGPPGSLYEEVNMSRKQELYQELLSMVLPSVRNACTRMFHGGRRWMFYRVDRERGCYYESELVHNLYVSMFDEEFIQHDIWFLNAQARWYLENANDRNSLHYHEIKRIIRELFEIVPDELRSGLQWSGPA